MENKEELEQYRKNFMAYFKKLKIANTLILLGAFIIFACDFIFLKDYATLPWIIAVVLIIAMFIIVNIIKKSLSTRTQKYVDTYYKNTSNYLLNNAKVTEIEFLSDDTLNIDSVNAARIMKEVVFTHSRNNLTFKLDDKEVKMADLVFKVTNPKDSKKPIIAFCGKFMQCQVEKEFEGRTLIYRKTTMPDCYGPNDIEGLEKIIDDDKLLVYSSNKNFKKIITSDILEKLNSIEINDYLYDFTISLNGNMIVIALSYADKIMVIPSYEEVPFEALDKVSKDLNVIINDVLKNL